MTVDSETVISVQDLSLCYRTRSGFLNWFEHAALKGISFELERGETLGILGRNGCGKSTLLRLLAGIVLPSSGQICFDKKLKRALLSLGVGFRPDLSGYDNALLSAMLQGASKKEALSLLPAINEFSELDTFFFQPVKTYSAGMRARLGFATAVMTKVDLLLIDEVLGVGDMHFREKAEKTMHEILKGKQTIVLVSHGIEQIKRVCDRAIWIESGVIKQEGDAVEVSKSYVEFMHGLDPV